jgi:hypothetical protein
MAIEEPGSTAIPTSGWKRDAVALAVLVALVLPVRLWLIGHTVVAARDSIGYIRYALEFEQLPWQEVWKKNHQHPGYPLAVLVVSEPLRWATGGTDAETMLIATQLTSLFAALLLLYPMYHLGCLLFNRTVGFGAALLFQYLPTSGHHLADGISEALFLLLAASTLLQAVRAFNERSLPRFVLCGLLCGLTYLTRPEGAMILLVVLVVLGAAPFVSTWRLSARRCIASAAALTVTSLLVCSLYVYATGRITNKLSALQVIDVLRHPFGERAGGDVDEPVAWSGGGPLFAVTFAPADRSVHQLARSTRALSSELCTGFHYAGIVFAAVGLAWSFGRLRNLPGFWVLAVYSSIHTATLLALAMTVSYVSDRHVMVLVLCGSYLVIAGLCELPRRVVGWTGTGGRSLLVQPAFWSLLLLAGLIGISVPKVLQPLHANRGANRAAGYWLAERLRPGDVVDDDHCWSHYYAGMVFKENIPEVVAPNHERVCYVVITRSRDTEINQSRKDREEKARARGGHVVHFWPEAGDVDAARVVIWAVPREPRTK